MNRAILILIDIIHRTFIDQVKIWYPFKVIFIFFFFFLLIFLLLNYYLMKIFFAYLGPIIFVIFLLSFLILLYLLDQASIERDAYSSDFIVDLNLHYVIEFVISLFLLFGLDEPVVICKNYVEIAHIFDEDPEHDEETCN